MQRLCSVEEPGTVVGELSAKAVGALSEKWALERPGNVWSRAAEATTRVAL